ncbi:MAG: hypothetical protein JWO78_97 [Micavibrio sp.]|nr:hypothetical protein [Micavibrio sp.]
MTQPTSVDAQNIASNPADYPRTYKYKRKDRFFITTICVVLFIIAALSHFFFPLFSPWLNEDFAKVVVPFLLTAASCVLLVFPWTARLTLGPDYIESRVFYIFWRRIKRNDIAGYKIKGPSWLISPHTILIPIDIYRSNLNIGRFETDTVFEKWYTSLPDYKLVWRNAMKRLSPLDKIGVFLLPEAVFGCISIIAWVLPSFWMPGLSTIPLSLILLLPPLCIFLALAKPQRFSFFGPSDRSFLFNATIPKIDVSSFYCSVLLLLSAWVSRHEMQDTYGFVDIWQILLVIITIFLILLVGSLFPFYKNRGHSFNRLLCLLLLANLTGAMSITFILNIRFDPSPPALASLPLAITRIEKTDNDYVTIEVAKIKNLKPSLAPSKTLSMHAARNRFKKGDIVCIYKHPGLFRIEWSRLDFCPKASVDKLKVKKITPVKKTERNIYRQFG